jgi:hypothetical protein
MKKPKKETTTCHKREKGCSKKPERYEENQIVPYTSQKIPSTTKSEASNL